MSNSGLSKVQRARGFDTEPGPELPANLPGLPSKGKSKVARSRGGRPSSLDDEKIAVACLYARLGATDDEIAESTGVSRATVYNWYNQFPQFLDAIKVGRDMADERVVRSLYKRATGYSQQVEKVFANGTRAVVTEHVPPDTGAAIFWLKNRRRGEWADRRELEMPDMPKEPGEVSIRQLALASIALLNAASYSADEPAMIDATPNQTEDTDNDPDFELDA